MGKIDPLVRVLWLSDIHFSSEYSANRNNELSSFLGAFDVFLKDLSSSSKFDYVLLSGDIAQSGEKEDYELFDEEILSKLGSYFKNAKLLVVPGNHDVNRKNISYVKGYVDSLPKDRNVFFEENKDAFKDSFSNYSNFLKECNWQSKCHSLKCNDHLFGHVLDIENKIIFILLNSSWYSIGDDTFLVSYISDYLKDITQKDERQVAREIANIANEYGKQILGLGALNEIRDIISLIEKYNDFLIVTTMHHPINWFDWSDRIPSENNIFSKIKKSTDLLLTGHEHVPKDFLSEYIERNSLLHIQAGCFMNYPGRGKPFSFGKNWFSTLEINTRKRTVKQKKVFFNPEEKKWQSFGKDEFFPLNKKYDSKLSEERKTELFRSFQLEGYVGNRWRKIKDLGNYFFLLDNSLYFFISREDFLETNFNIDFINFIKLIIQEKKKKIYFTFFDIYHSKFEDYSDTNDKLKVLNIIKDDFDYKFDMFRCNFFKSLNVSNAKQLKNLKLIGVVLPYWEVEKFL